MKSAEECREAALDALVEIAGNTASFASRIQAARELLLFADERQADAELVAEAVQAAVKAAGAEVRSMLLDPEAHDLHPPNRIHAD